MAWPCFACPFVILQEQQKSQKYQKQLEDIKTQINKSGNKSAVCILYSPYIYSLEIVKAEDLLSNLSLCPPSPTPPPPPHHHHHHYWTHAIGRNTLMLPAKYKQYIISHLLKGRSFFCSPRCLIYWRFNSNNIIVIINLIMILEKAMVSLWTVVNFFFYYFLITDQTFG